MDVELLARMVGDLILDHDALDLPGLGCFVAQDMPASFSDRGYTINPPYRRLSFTETVRGDSLLAELYARDNGRSPAEAAAIIGEFLSGLAATLREEKAVDLPGLGRLRATRENHFFFVADEDLDISPDACGLDPVSLKTHRAVTLPDVPVAPPVAAPVAAAPDEKSSEISQPEPETAVSDEKSSEISQPEPETAVSDGKSSEISQPAPETAHSDGKSSEISQQEPETTVSDENSAKISLPAAQEPASAPETASAATPAPEATTTAPTVAPAKPRRPLPASARWAIGVAASVALLLGGFVALSRLAPDFTDKLLYTEEELSIINAPEDGTGLPG